MWITVHTFILPQEAYFAKGLLESTGMKVEIRDELTVQVDNFISNATSGIRLQVLENNVEQAMEVLKKGGYIKSKKNARPHRIETITVALDNLKDTCPYCSSNNTVQDEKLSLKSLISLRLSKALLSTFKHHYHCFDCDRNWKYRVINK